MTPNETEKIKLMQLFRQGKIDTLPNVNSPEYKASKIKDMMSKANTNESNIEEMTRDQFERMDGLVDQSLLIKFLDTFEEIFSDYVEGGDEFFSDDVINYLSMMMQNRAQDARLDSRSFGEGVNEGDPIVDETEFNFFKEFFGIGSDNVIPNTNATDKEIEAYLKSDDYQEELKYSDLEEKDIANWVESFLDWRSKNTLQEVDGGVEFFKRIAFKK